MKRLLKLDFIRFCLVGASGFTINLALLTIFYKGLGFPIFVSQLIGCEVSLFTNFLLHHHWTYKENNVTKRIEHLLWQFHVTSWVAILGISALVSIQVKFFKLNYVLALAIASIVALGWNFYWSKYVIWRHQHDLKAHS